MISDYKSFDKEDTYRLIDAAQKGDRAARELIVNQNIGLVKNLAMKYASSFYEPEDLIQVGFVGLVKAIDRFNTSFDVRFSTYAVPMILGEIKRFLRDDGRIKVSRQLKLEMKNLKNLQMEYYNAHGVSPKISYIAKKMNISKERVMEILEAIDSLSGLESLDNEYTPECDFANRGVNEEDRNVSRIDLRDAIKSLEGREKEIIVLRYYKDMTQQQIAKVLGISQVQVSRIEKKVLSRMKARLESKESSL